MSTCDSTYNGKPWGGEWLLESNEKYSFKKLVVLKNEMCSLQYHKEKRETIFILQGSMILWLEDEKIVLKPSDFFTITPGTTHRMEGITDCWYLEASTSELDDVVRLDDKYGR